MENLKEVELKKILHNCKKATYLIERRQLEKITPEETWELELHLGGCPICETYRRQSILINDWIAKVLQINDSNQQLGARFKKRLQELLNAQIAKKGTRYFSIQNSSGQPQPSNYEMYK